MLPDETTRFGPKQDIKVDTTTFRGEGGPPERSWAQGGMGQGTSLEKAGTGGKRRDTDIWTGLVCQRALSLESPRNRGRPREEGIVGWGKSAAGKNENRVPAC